MGTTNSMARVIANIRELMEMQGWTQRALASRVGMHQPQLAKLLSGRQDATIGSLEKIADALGVDILLLFRQSHKKSRKTA